jgi:CTP synthase
MAQALRLEVRPVDVSPWQRLMENIDTSTELLRIGMVGKYVGLEDAYFSLNE